MAPDRGQAEKTSGTGWREKFCLPSALVIWAGTALAVALLLVLLPPRLVLPWAVAGMDGASVMCFAVVAWLAALDVRMRADSASLPAIVIGAVLSVGWLAHLLTFPGILPGRPGSLDANTDAWLYVALHLALPSLLAAAALYVPGQLTDGARAVRAAVALGLALAFGLLAVVVVLATSPLEAARDDMVGPASRLLGVLGLVPVAAAGILLLGGRLGDERIIRGIAPALLLTGLNSVLLMWLHARYSPVWYASHVLLMAIAICLLYGQLNLFARAIRAEQRATARLKDSFLTAEVLASSLKREIVIDQLLERGMVAVQADRALICRVQDDAMVVEGTRALHEALPTARETHPLSSAPVILAAVRQRRLQLRSGPIAPTWFSVTGGHGMSASRHTLAVPLIYADELVGVLVLARTRDVPFGSDEVAAVDSIATVAALALRNARQVADIEETSQAKTLFLNLAAHELRTPLSVVRGYASMLLDGSMGHLPDESAGAITILQSKSEELAHLVEGLLIASRLEAGRARARCQDLDVRMVVGAAVERLRPSAELRGAQVDVDVPGKPALLRADPEYLDRILDNLLVNAVTYSKGRPWLRISGTCTSDDRIEVAVEDHGVGLRPDDHQRIFERFERVEHGQLGSPAGTGLGLYLSRRLAEEMGGSVRLDWSRPGQGSRFVLELPLAQGLAVQAAGASAGRGQLGAIAEEPSGI